MGCEFASLISPRDGACQVEDLFRLLKYVRCRFPAVDAVVSGAILSNYQVPRR